MQLAQSTWVLLKTYMWWLNDKGEKQAGLHGEAPAEMTWL